MTIIFIIIVAVVLLWFFVTYNLFIKDKNLIREAWSGIDVQLKRRHNLIPALVDIVKGYSAHERKLFNEIAEKRSKAAGLKNINEKSEAETEISGMLKNIFAVVENYPNLKANVNFLDLQKQLVEMEDHIQYARRYYNGTVRNYNIKVESFPGNIVAKLFNFKQKDYFEITLATERKTPEVNL